MYVCTCVCVCTLVHMPHTVLCGGQSTPSDLRGSFLAFEPISGGQAWQHALYPPSRLTATRLLHVHVRVINEVYLEV